MLKSNNTKTTNNLIVNSLIELGDDLAAETKGKGRKFISKFIEPGVAHYDEFGDVLITKETLDKFIRTMVGCPVIIKHKDISDKNADKERVGVISNVWFNEMDGWYYCDGIIWDKQAIDLVKNQGWSVSCTYDFESDKKPKTHNGKKIDMEFTDGEFLHLALVDNPRYERANIVMNSKAENADQWITIKPNGEEHKGRHLLVKDGETPKEAIERTYDKSEKSDTKEERIKARRKHQEVVKKHNQAYKDFEDGKISMEELDKADKELEKSNKEFYATPDTKDKQFDSKTEKKYNYTLTKREVEDRKTLGGMADTGNYYTNGDFAIDKKYLNIKGQEPIKKEEIEKPLKNILQGDSTYRYTPVKDFEIGELKREYGKPIKVAKYSYYDEKYGYERNIYLSKKYNDLFKNFDLKFGGETEPVFAYRGKDIVGVVMPINAKEQSYSKVENGSEEYEIIKEQLQLLNCSQNSLTSIFAEAIAEVVTNCLGECRNWSKENFDESKVKRDGGKFAKQNGSPKPKLRSYKTTLDKHKQLGLVEKFPPDFLGNTEKEIADFLGIKGNKPAIFKTPIETVKIYRSNFSHIDHEKDKTRILGLSRAIAALKNPNIIIQDGKENYYIKFFQKGNNDKIHMQVIRTKKQGGFYKTNFPISKNRYETMKGQIMYDLSSKRGI